MLTDFRAKLSHSRMRLFPCTPTSLLLHATRVERVWCSRKMVSLFVLIFSESSL